MPQLIGVAKEVFSNEKRVATVPDIVAKLMKLVPDVEPVMTQTRSRRPRSMGG